MVNKTILGTSFDDFVDKQLSIRSKILSGEGSRDLEFNTYTTSRNAFLRLSSGVDIDIEKAKILGNPDWAGNNLAKSYVLQSGTVSGNSNPKLSDLKFGILGEKSAYTVGGTDDFGLRPMPGIQTFSIKSRGRWGSLREANINIKCFNRDQLSIVETLYMRPGYSILVEWGHTSFFNNESKLLNDNNISFFDFFNGNLTRRQIYDELLIKQEKYGGNYDAFIGPVANFNIITNPDGTYDCSMQVYSWGWIIDSLKVNNSQQEILSVNGNIVVDPNNISRLPFVPTSIYENTSVSPETLGKSKLESLLNSYNKTCNQTRFNDGKGHKIFITDIYKRDLDNDPLGNAISKEATPINVSDLSIFTSIPFKISSKGTDNNIDNSDMSSFISLGTLLSVISRNCLLYTISKETPIPVAVPKLDPIVNINFNTEENLCYSPSTHISVDPTVCMIKFWRGDTFKTFNVPDPKADADVVEKYLPEFKFKDRENTGKTMMIMVNINYILKILRGFEDSNRDIHLLSFLEKLMEGITLALGKLNEFYVLYDEPTNTVFINDKQFLGGKGTVSVINTTGLKSSVRSLKISSKLTNEIASTIAIGAQSSGVSVGVDASVLTEYNKGLTDRLVPTKKNYASSNDIKEEEEYKKSLKEDIRVKENISITLDNIYNKRVIILEDVDKCVSFYSDIANTLRAKSKNKATQIIPFMFDIKMDGISGIKYGQVFSIETSRLPRTYLNPDDITQPLICFLVTGVDHEIVNNTWLTTIVGQAAPLRGYKIKI